MHLINLLLKGNSKTEKDRRALRTFFKLPSTYSGQM